MINIMKYVNDYIILTPNPSLPPLSLSLSFSVHTHVHTHTLSALYFYFVTRFSLINVSSQDGRISLHYASSSGHTGVVKVLVDSGAQLSPHFLN